MKKTVELAQGEMRIELYRIGRGFKEYDVELLRGTWPTDKEIINLCDGAPADVKTALHKGGTVQKITSKTASVKVFQ